MEENFERNFTIMPSEHLKNYLFRMPSINLDNSKERWNIYFRLHKVKPENLKDFSLNPKG